jgi:phosphoribosylformylglycinamidine cyclo-ligase
LDRPWPVPPVFRWLAATGRVDRGEMLRVFNCGVGMALVIGHGAADAAEAMLRAAGETVFRLGRIATASGAAAVRFDAVPDFA